MYSQDTEIKEASQRSKAAPGGSESGHAESVSPKTSLTTTRGPGLMRIPWLMGVPRVFGGLVLRVPLVEACWRAALGVVARLGKRAEGLLTGLDESRDRRTKRRVGA